jgi:hypothetical protein
LAMLEAADRMLARSARSMFRNITGI